MVTSTDHPSVQQIHERVAEAFPYITMATVYSTLAMLEKKGMVQELPFQKLSKYDANLAPHANLVCVSCGKVADSDIGQDRIAVLRDEVAERADFKIASQRVDFYGWSLECAGKHKEMTWSKRLTYKVSYLTRSGEGFSAGAFKVLNIA